MSKAFFKPEIFRAYSGVSAVHSQRDLDYPGDFSMLHGASEEVVTDNRKKLAELAGFEPNRLATPKQVAGDTIVILDPATQNKQRQEGDAIMTNEPGWLLGVTIADCVAILLYDPKNQAVAAVHSGWRGSSKNIAAQAVKAMLFNYQSDPTDLIAYISPAPDRFEYEVGHDVSRLFENRYWSYKSDDKDWFDNKLVVHDQLLGAGLKPKNVEVDPRSSMHLLHFHSHRRDSHDAGRMIVGIGLK